MLKHLKSKAEAKKAELEAQRDRKRVAGVAEEVEVFGGAQGWRFGSLEAWQDVLQPEIRKAREKAEAKAAKEAAKAAKEEARLAARTPKEVAADEAKARAARERKAKLLGKVMTKASSKLEARLLSKVLQTVASLLAQADSTVAHAAETVLAGSQAAVTGAGAGAGAGAGPAAVSVQHVKALVKGVTGKPVSNALRLLSQVLNAAYAVVLGYHFRLEVPGKRDHIASIQRVATTQLVRLLSAFVTTTRSVASKDLERIIANARAINAAAHQARGVIATGVATANAAMAQAQQLLVAVLAAVRAICQQRADEARAAHRAKVEAMKAQALAAAAAMGGKVAEVATVASAVADQGADAMAAKALDLAQMLEQTVIAFMQQRVDAVVQRYVSEIGAVVDKVDRSLVIVEGASVTVATVGSAAQTTLDAIPHLTDDNLPQTVAAVTAHCDALFTMTQSHLHAVVEDGIYAALNIFVEGEDSAVSAKLMDKLC